MRPWQEAARAVCRRARDLVAITGAGISVDSGLPDASQVVRDYQMQGIFSSHHAHRHQREFCRLYTELSNRWGAAAPNQAHLALARRHAKIITLNLDGLHTQAGSRDVIELHGSLRSFCCLQCGARHSQPDELTACVCGVCSGALWPDVVLEGEPVRHLGLALEWLSFADALLIIGTSLSDNPVRQLPQIAKENGAPVIVVNRRADDWVPYYLET